MASITGDNVLVAAWAIIILMVVVVLVMLVSVFNSGGLLSLSLADLVNKKPAVVTEVSEDEEEDNEDTVEEELDIDTARQLLGFVEYPVVNVQTDVVNIFSPEVATTVFRLSEEEIVARCAFFGISFNHDRCMLAERSCAAVLGSNEEHSECLHKYEYYRGQKL